MKEEFYKKNIEESLAELKSSANGLSNIFATERLFESQKYQIKPQKKQSFFVKFLMQIKELMVLILLVSAVVSIAVGVIEKSKGEIIDGAIILGIVIMNALFGVFQENKSEKAIENLKNMTQAETLVLRDGNVTKIKACEIVFGDVVYLESGSIVPADIRLIESYSLKVNESSLTGESVAVEKHSDIVYEKNISVSDRKNILYSGSVIESGHAKGVVFAIGQQTEIGKIAQTIKETKKEMTPLQKNIQGVGKILTFLILLVAGITFVLEVVSNPKEILQAFLTAVAISVAAIPESMPAVITIIMSLGISKLSKQKAIVKRMHAVETLGACDIICSDKTGTITQNKMKVEEFFTFFDKNSENFEIFLNSMVLCNDAVKGEKDFVGGSTEIALLHFAEKFGVKKIESEQKFKRLDEIPFDSKRKMMSTLNEVNGKKICFTKGALDRVLKHCTHCLINGVIKELSKAEKEIIQQRNKSMCKNALRVISFAFKEVSQGSVEENNLVFLGLCGIQDPPRAEIFDAVEKCRKAGMRPIMITGDYRDTAFAIAKKVGIAQNENDVMSGEEIDNCDEQTFCEIVEKKSVFARVSPAHKVRIVEALKRNGHIVAMTGDGVNDAPSLKKADIGIGMGKTGTDVTKEVSDILITDDNFATIVVAVEEGRKIYSNIQKTIKYLFSANMAEILALFFVTILCPNMTFLLPAQILFVNLITDSLPAIALGVEPVEKDIMSEKPRRKSDGLFSNGIGLNLLVLGSIQTVLTLCAYFLGLKMYGENVAITMAFYTLNLIQLFYMFTARTKEFCFKSNPFKNKFFNISLLFGFGILAIIAFTKFREILQLVALNWGCWLIVFLLSISVVFVGEFYKFCEIKLKKKLH